MSWTKYTNWYQNHRYKAKFYDLYDQKKGKYLDKGVMAKYKNFQLYLEEREVIIDNGKYTRFSIIKPNGEKVEFMYSGYLDSVPLDDEFTDRVKEIIKEDKKKGIKYNTQTMLNDLENVEDELGKVYRKDNEVRKNFWKYSILQWLEYQAEMGDKRKYNYEITPRQVNNLAEQLKDNEKLCKYLENVVIDYLKDYEKEENINII